MIDGVIRKFMIKFNSDVVSSYIKLVNHKVLEIIFICYIIQSHEAKQKKILVRNLFIDRKHFPYLFRLHLSTLKILLLILLSFRHTFCCKVVGRNCRLFTTCYWKMYLKFDGRLNLRVQSCSRSMLSSK